VTPGLVWAQSRDGVVGRDGALPWHLPEDLAHFKRLTTGSVVVMGRRTWQSLPERFRPLPGRTNVVLTRDPAFAAPGAVVLHDVATVLARYPDAWVIGGGAVWAAFLDVAAEAVVTTVDVDVEGDVRAPVLDAGWEPVERLPADGWDVSATGLRYAVTRYRRAPRT
jgi:dihydrofolate reductase